VAELVFNLDELGISDWKDCKTKTVLVPATMVGQTIHHEISRMVKHISVIACVSAAEESFTPYIIMSQASGRVWEQFKKHDVRFRADFVLRSNPKPHINAKRFLDYIRTVFLPNLAEFRTLDGVAEGTGVLLMDICPSYATDDVMGLSRRPGCASYLLHYTQLKSFKFLM
jgi:hypothetical protein